MTLTTILIILLVLALAGGGYAAGTYGWVSYSPAGLILLWLLILFLMGRL